MADYAELVRCIRDCWDTSIGERVGDVTVCHCDECLFKDYVEEHDGWTDYTPCETRMALAAADAIEELLKAARKMHLWIFLNTGDEQKAYEECGLSDEMNAALGYGGQFKISVPKESV
ncbi:MAG: hypothetical protein J6S14_19815 [Clostridia bacterium]|nr:hypothetical protein [Clostridia bacterium]